MDETEGGFEITITEDFLFEEEGESKRVINGISVYQRPEGIKTRGHWEGSHYIAKSITGRWSKYGGGRSQGYKEEIQDFWFCQSCSQKQPETISPYLKELDGEFYRVCSICLVDDCKKLLKRMSSA